MKNQVKNMILLKKIAETIKGHKITENCFQQEDDKLGDFNSKSEVQISSPIEEMSPYSNLAWLGGSFELANDFD